MKKTRTPARNPILAFVNKGSNPVFVKNGENTGAHQTGILRSSVEDHRAYRRSPSAPTAPMRIDWPNSENPAPYQEIGQMIWNGPFWGSRPQMARFGGPAPDPQILPFWDPKNGRKIGFVKCRYFSRFLTFLKRRYYSTGKMPKKPFFDAHRGAPRWAFFCLFLAWSQTWPKMVKKRQKSLFLVTFELFKTPVL